MVSIRMVHTERHPFVQAVVLLAPLLVLPVALPDGWSLPTGTAPAIWVLGALAVMVGLPFFALSTVSPTLQMWFASTDHPRADDPYFLYAAGNVGSVGALLAYPLVLEPLFSLQTQTRIWAVGYGAFVLAMLTAARSASVHRSPNVDRVETDVQDIDRGTRARWLLLSFIPSVLVLGVTLHISTDVASFPLLWVLPLVLYLFTFIIAFASDNQRRVRFLSSFVFFAAVPLGFISLFQSFLSFFVLTFHLVWFFAAALLCHSKLAVMSFKTGRVAAHHWTTHRLLPCALCGRSVGRHLRVAHRSDNLSYGP